MWLSYFHVDLCDNIVTVISDFAFKNLSTINATFVYMHLQNNRISQIERHAFYGIEKDIALIDLTNKNLTQLPSAF